MYFKLQKPDILPDSKKVWDKIMHDSHLMVTFFSFFKSVSAKDYVYWDKLRHLPVPEGLTHEEHWSAIRYFRKIQSNETEIKDHASGNNFTWFKQDFLDKFCHELDLNMGGSLHVGQAAIDPKQKNMFISRGVLEEAISSSQLEGAHTTRKAAKKMILENRKPTNDSERMILNNYKTMVHIESELKDSSMSRSLLFQMHAEITDGVINVGEKGRFRKDEDEIVVQDKIKGIIYHVPPEESFLQKEIEKLISFMNDEDSDEFIHPLIKAILIHFWFGYLHPFTDGNGRMARLLFYWYLLKKGYWAFSFLPISSVIKKSPEQYGMAYVYAEQDDLDLTYFIDYNLKKIQQAINEFNKYVDQKQKENRAMMRLAHNSHNLNQRQIQLLQFLHENPSEFTTMTMHMNSHQVSKVTAIKDLKGLAKFGFLNDRKQGKYSRYYPTAKVDDLFEKA